MKVDLSIPQSEVNRLLDQVKVYQLRKRREIAELIERTANDIARTARANVPVDEGDLKRSIKVVLEEVAFNYGATVGFGGKGARHAHLVELGTSKMAAKPFLIPAYEAHIHRFIIDLRRIVSS